MAPVSARSRPFVFTFYPNGSVIDEAAPEAPSSAGRARRRIIPVNSFAPIDIENDQFKGAMMVIHDTGNEPERLHEDAMDEPAEACGDMRGVQLQIQGKFKGAMPPGTLWAGGELQDALKLGWFMQNVVKMCANYAKKKTEGRLHFSLGGKGEMPMMMFPITQVFSVLATPPGQEPPKLGSKEVTEKMVWQGPIELEINTQDIFTLCYKTPFVDLCSWELLKVPHVSPLPLENLLGDIQASRVMLYNSALAGTHANWRKGVVIEWLFVRGKPGEKWYEDDILDGRKDDILDGQKVDPSPQDMNVAALDEGSDASDSSQGDEIVDLIDDEDDDACGGPGEDSDCSSESSQESLIGEDEEALRRDESHLLSEIEGWRPRRIAPHLQVDEDLGVAMRVPYYIEAIDRRRRRKLRVWYVFAIADMQGGDEWWHAKPITELLALCDRRRMLRTRLKTFRRGSARGCQCYGVQTLEQFRHVVRSTLSAKDSKMKQAVLKSAGATTAENAALQTQSEDQTQDRLAPLPWELNIKENIKGLHTMSKVELARKIKRRRNKPIVLPPRFLVGAGSAACELAFAHAREGRSSSDRESLVGVVEFEGRICEELLRLSKDGFLRAFTPYDCDKPRVKLAVSQIEKADAVDGLFLGRFFRWQVHTELKVFLFCCANSQERDDWIGSVQNARQGEQPARPFTVPLSVVARGLMDDTRARRWRPKKRLVLNDRILLDDAVEPMPANVVEGMLELVLTFRTVAVPEPPQMMQFLNQTCMLKAVRFSDLSQSDLLAFWLNVYHCLLLHGRLMLGTPRSRGELSRFFNRVSYLVGLRPVSLKEIERMIFRLPNLDSFTGIRATGRARARQFVGFCGFCRRRTRVLTSGEGDLQSPNAHLTIAVDKSNPGTSPRASSRSPRAGSSSDSSPQGFHCSEASARLDERKNRQKLACFPHIGSMNILPEPPWSRRRVHACLFLGRASEAFAIPKQDLRIVLCLNRGNASCLPNVPVFKAKDLDGQLDEVAKDFVREFVRVQESGNEITRATFPHSCKCLKRELNMDQDMLISFVWKFMAPERPKPSRRLQVKFDKYRPEPRYGLEIDRRKGLEVGSEYAVVTAAAQALARFMEKVHKDKTDRPSSSKAQSRETRSPASSRNGDKALEAVENREDCEKTSSCQQGAASSDSPQVGSPTCGTSMPSTPLQRPVEASGHAPMWPPVDEDGASGESRDMSPVSPPVDEVGAFEKPAPTPLLVAAPRFNITLATTMPPLKLPRDPLEPPRIDEFGIATCCYARELVEDEDIAPPTLYS